MLESMKTFLQVLVLVFLIHAIHTSVEIGKCDACSASVCITALAQLQHSLGTAVLILSLSVLSLSVLNLSVLGLSLLNLSVFNLTILILSVLHLLVLNLPVFILLSWPNT